MKKISGCMALFVSLCLTLSACGGTPAATNTVPPSNTANPGQTTDKPTADATETHAPASITFGTASSSGAFYAVGAGMASVVEQNSNFLSVLVQATKGGAENTELISAHQMELGFASTSHAYCSLTDSGFCEGNGSKDLAGVMALYPNFWHMLVRSDLNVDTYADLKGLRVCLGTSVPEITAISKAVLTAHGVDSEKDITAFYLSQDEACQKLADGDIDAAAIMTGVPTALFTNLTVDDTCKLVDGDPEILAALTAEDGALNFVQAGTIPAGTYNNDKDVHAIYSTALIMTYPDVDEAVIYEFCKQVYENWDTVKLSHSALNDVVLDDLDQTKIPLHPGAEKFYREVGILG